MLAPTPAAGTQGDRLAKEAVKCVAFGALSLHLGSLFLADTTPAGLAVDKVQPAAILAAFVEVIDETLALALLRELTMAGLADPEVALGTVIDLLIEEPGHEAAAVTPVLFDFVLVELMAVGALLLGAGGRPTDHAVEDIALSAQGPTVGDLLAFLTVPSELDGVLVGDAWPELQGVPILALELPAELLGLGQVLGFVLAFEQVGLERFRDEALAFVAEWALQGHIGRVEGGEFPGRLALLRTGVVVRLPLAGAALANYRLVDCADHRARRDVCADQATHVVQFFL